MKIATEKENFLDIAFFPEIIWAPELTDIFEKDFGLDPAAGAGHQREMKELNFSKDSNNDFKRILKISFS